MKLSKTRYIRLFKYIDEQRIIKKNGRKTKVNYASYQGVFDLENQDQFAWAMHKIQVGGWLPFAINSYPGINLPLELDEQYLTENYEDAYKKYDEKGYYATQDLLKIAAKYEKNALENSKNAIINQRKKQCFNSYIQQLAVKFKAGELIPEIFVSDVEEFIRFESNATIETDISTDI